MSWYDRAICVLIRWLVRRLRFSTGVQRVFWPYFVANLPQVDPGTGLFIEPHGMLRVDFGTPHRRSNVVRVVMSGEMMTLLEQQLTETLDQQNELYQTATGEPIYDYKDE